jgi:uncharacterized protein (DUF1501 family)
VSAVDRRSFLIKTLGAACCAAASPLITPMTFAAAPGENRLVIIILRGGMDGLSVFAPYADRNWRTYRPTLARAPEKSLIDLDGSFGMHRDLAALEPMWRAGELAVVQAVSTPYRGKRSHFDGQDILEAGVVDHPVEHGGWLNRAIAHMAGARPETALSVGRESMLLMRGGQPTRAWSPGDQLTLRDSSRGLLRMIYAKDPLFARSAETAEILSENSGMAPPRPALKVRSIAAYAAERLSAEARVAAFSVGGWDTHAEQEAGIAQPLAELSDALTGLKEGLGLNWSRTMVIAMTEFGRTARENGNLGTDHGTGGAALLAGGAVRGGRVYGNWPGLNERELYENRDLMPTVDVRHYPAWALVSLFGLSREAVTGEVFPGLDMGAEAHRFIA